jgi:hypothetical protein
MPIKTGIGIGEAQVFDTNDIVNTFIKQYQLKQKEDQLFAERIADNLSKFDTTGLTGKDLERATKMYDDLKGFNQNLYNLSGKEKTLLDAQIRKGMNDIKTFSANAKQFYKDRENFGVEYNKDAYSFLPDVKPYVDKVTTLSYGEALDQNLADINSYRMKRVPDMRVVDDIFSDFAKAIKGLTDDSKPITETVNNVTTTYRIADPKAVDAAARVILTDDGKKFAVADQFKKQNPNVPPPTDDDLVAFIKKVYENKNGGPTSAYKFNYGDTKASTGGSAKEPSSGDKFVLAVNGAFSRDEAARNRYINQLKAHSKTNVSDIVYNADGTLSVIPFVKSKFTGKMKVGDPIRVANAVELNNQLGGLGITQSGFDVVTGLNQSAPSGGTQTSTPSGGKKYIIGGKSFTEDQVKRAAEASKMTVQQYLKQVNGK